MPVYEKILDTGKGPQVYTVDGSIVAPDLFCFSLKKAFWVEAKTKNAFTWHRRTSRFVTGIDIRHYEDYLSLQEKTKWDIWLLFLQLGGKAKDNPEDVSPSGLFGNTLNYLSKNENHRHDNWGKSGMVYWSIDSLKRIATLENLELSLKPINSN